MLEAIASAAAFAIVAAGAARAADIAVLTGGAPKEVLNELTPKFEQATGHKVRFTYIVVSAIRQKLEAGEPADVLLMPSTILETMAQDGLVNAEQRALLGKLLVGVAVREGAAMPDIATPESFRKTLLDARSIAHSTSATPSGVHVARMLERMGIADAVRAKTVQRAALDGGAELVANGTVELGLYPMSEIAHVKGVALAGPIPAPLNMDVTYAAGVTRANRSGEAALAFVRFLSDPANRQAWIAAGFGAPDK
jgi:molybdate transport system substrate-binding protein